MPDRCRDTSCELPAGHIGPHKTTLRMSADTEPTEQMRRIAFTIAMSAVDHEVAELKRSNKRNLRLAWYLGAAIALNLGVALLNLVRVG